MKKNDQNTVKQNNWKRYVSLYTVVFVILLFFVFGYFFFKGKSFVWHMDGREQHFQALAYYGKWLRSILKNHHFNTYTFGLGYGGDILQTLSYYVIGDPLNLLSVFVPVRYTFYLYEALILLRLYLAGIAFSHYCWYKNQKNTSAVLSGTLIYIFSSYALFASVRHPYFINPMIYFPFLLEGIERFHDDSHKPWLFIFMVALSASSNFYFFYMIVVMAVFYVFIHLYYWYHKDIKKALLFIVKLLGIGIIGLMISMFLFMPVVLFYLNDPRTKVKTVYGLLYESTYYRQMFSDFIGYGRPGHWAYLGYGALSITCIFTLLVRKRNRVLKAAFILLTIGMMIPAFGSFMNGFSYPVNRWIWAYSMLVGYITVTVFDDFMVLTRKQTLVILGLLTAYVVISLSLGDHNLQLLFAILMFVFIMGYRFFSTESFRHQKKIVENVLVVFTVFAVVFNAFSAYGVDNYIKEFIDFDDARSSIFETDAYNAKQLAEKDNQTFTRYTGRYLEENASLLQGISSTQYYWSLGNPYIAMFNSEMALPDNRSFKYYDLDDRTALQELASINYMYVDSGDPLAYDYSISSYNGLHVNQNELPLGYAYTGYMTEKQYEQLDLVEKEDALLKSAHIDKNISGLENSSDYSDVKHIAYTLEPENYNVSQKKNTFIVTKNNTSITLYINPVKNAETYVTLKGMQYEGFTDMDLYNEKAEDPNGTHNIVRWNSLGIAERERLEEKDASYVEPNSLPITVSFSNYDKSKTKKFFRYYTPKHQYYAGRHDFTINSGYKKDGIRSITINFPQMGTYTFDSISVEALTMDHYEEDVSSLKNNVLENINLHEDDAYSTKSITGDIHSDQKELLCVTIPYAKGWEAYVDGKKTDIIRTNTMYMGIVLEKGDHQISLVYHTPGLKEGLLITGMGIVSCFILYFVLKKKSS